MGIHMSNQELKERMRLLKIKESAEQEAVCEYLEYLHIPFYHVPNGGSRNKIEAANLKRQGVRAGVPDLCITVAKGKYHGLYIEMKVDDNKPSKEQKDWLSLLNKNGYLAVVCYGFNDAKQTIDKYLKL